jgi:excisionase family DNA binding protein
MALQCIVGHMEETQKMYAVPAAAERIGIDPRTLRASIRAGEIRCTRIGRRWLIPSTEVDRLLAGAPPGMPTSGATARSPESTHGATSRPEGPNHV